MAQIDSYQYYKPQLKPPIRDLQKVSPINGRKIHHETRNYSTSNAHRKIDVVIDRKTY